MGQWAWHGAPTDARTLLSRVLTPQTRYLVFDLDRTIHLGHNLGELLGWELTAWFAYGAEHWAEAGVHGPVSRFRWDAPTPLALARYLTRGATTWAYPGLHYLLWSRILPHWTDRGLYRTFGSEPRPEVQLMPTLALLHDLSRLPLETSRTLADAVFERCAPDQVIDREDIAWVQATFPELTVILSSASPQPMVEAAADALGITDYVHTEVEVHAGRLSAPPQWHPLLSSVEQPEWICPPSAFRLNAGHRKIGRLLERYPDFLDVETVGVSDTTHGEDHPWISYFSRVVDINSPTPFPVLVPEDARLEAVHSAELLTRREKDEGVVDARRLHLPRHGNQACTLDAAALASRWSATQHAADRLAETYRAEWRALADERRRGEALQARLETAQQAATQAYNAAPSAESFAKVQRKSAAVTRARARTRLRMRPLLDVRAAIEQVVATSAAMPTATPRPESR
ncbi:MAG: hypothetical protein KC933_14170 [Myxococcales bacterium]|nr:hypothetical protein [Myxococcales bacterium]